MVGIASHPPEADLTMGRNYTVNISGTLYFTAYHRPQRGPSSLECVCTTESHPGGVPQLHFPMVW